MPELIRNHAFSPLTFYDANGENPIQTDWCGHLNGPSLDEAEVCGQLANMHAPREPLGQATMADPVPIPDEAVEAWIKAHDGHVPMRPGAANRAERIRAGLAAVYPILAAEALRRVADECDAIHRGAEIGEFVPTAETWMRHRADQIEHGEAIWQEVAGG
jgi:hypothetical protein